MNHESRRKPWGFAHWGMTAFSATVLVLMAGCGAENPADYGGGGLSEGMGGKGAGDIAPRDTIHDVRWDLQGDAAQVVAPISNATACTSGAQCPTGNCVDGFCCDNKCDNKCMACSAAKKGSGVDGICGSIKYDTDPDNDCPYGGCDGKNMCKNYNGFSCTSSAQCLSNYCVDGFCCGNICMGACQACSTAKKGGGSNGVCGSIAVNTDPDNECNPGECMARERARLRKHRQQMELCVRRLHNARLVFVPTASVATVGVWGRVKLVRRPRKTKV
jgi:hypothetical protein